MESATTERELSGEKAQRIIDAMRDSVAKRGAAGSTFEHVAREAGVSRGLLHYYFGTKERLLVEGQVLSVGGSSSRTYLNFGADFRTDFTVSVAGRDRRTFAAAGLDLKGLEGHIIRVRGWLDSINGPMVEATHPEQIELVQ